MQFLGLDYRKNWRTILSRYIREGKIKSREMAYLIQKKCIITAPFKVSGEIREKMQYGIHQGRPEYGVKPGQMGRTGMGTWTVLAGKSWTEGKVA